MGKLERESQPLSGLRGHWVFGPDSKVPQDIILSLEFSQTFLRYAGRHLNSPHPDFVTNNPLALSKWVATTNALTNPNLLDEEWEKGKNGTLDSASLRLLRDQRQIGAEVSIRTAVTSLQMYWRGKGVSLETMASKLFRPSRIGTEYELGLEFDSGYTGLIFHYLRGKNGQLYVRDPNTYKGGDGTWEWHPDQWADVLKYTSFYYNLSKASDEIFKPLPIDIRYSPGGARCLPTTERVTMLPDDEIDFLTREITDGKQPFVLFKGEIDEDTLFDHLPNLGVRLKTMPSSQIRELADSGHTCGPDCQMYHASVKNYKELGELIAPVDGKLFGDALFDHFILTKEKGNKEKYRILIPAQADETTIVGIIDRLHEKGLSDEDIKNQMSFTVSDLCPTPLLRVYAALKDRDLLDAVSYIGSVDVFSWADPMEERFHFVAVDHFVDLFPKEGSFSQTNVLKTLKDALTPDGLLFTTVRCGESFDLTSETVMKGFYQKTESLLRELMRELPTAYVEMDKNTRERHIETIKSNYELVQTIYALCVYMNLRNVHPFLNKEELADCMLKAIGDHPAEHMSITLTGRQDKLALRIENIPGDFTSKLRSSFQGTNPDFL